MATRNTVKRFLKINLTHVQLRVDIAVVRRNWHPALDQLVIAVNRPGGRERATRLCPACVGVDERGGAVGEVEDERHVLMECPDYEDLRAPIWGCGIDRGAHMRTVMGMAEQDVLAKVLADNWKRRVSL